MEKKSQLQSFYADVEAARLANVPVELTSRSLLQTSAPPSVSQIRDLADHENRSTGSIDERHQAAINIHSQLGSMVPVLDGLSARTIARREFSLIIKRVLWYLALVLLVCLLGLLYFQLRIVPKYELMREEMRLYYHMTEFNFDLFAYHVPVTIVVAVLLLVVLMQLLTNKNRFLLSCFGGRKYVRLRVSSAAARTLGLLASQQSPLADATQTTATLYAIDQPGRHEFGSALGDSVDRVGCQMLSEYWSLEAAKTLERARTLAPLVLLLVIGGGVAVVYGFVVYGPVIGLLRDLVEAGLPL